MTELVGALLENIGAAGIIWGVVWLLWDHSPGSGGIWPLGVGAVALIIGGML